MKVYIPGMTRPASFGSRARPLSSSSTGSSSGSSGATRYSDRFIPSRTGSGDFRAAFSLLSSGCNSASGNGENAPNASNSSGGLSSVSSQANDACMSEGMSQAGKQSYDFLLKSELLDLKTCGSGKVVLQSSSGPGTGLPGAGVVEDAGIVADSSQDSASASGRSANEFFYGRASAGQSPSVDRGLSLSRPNDVAKSSRLRGSSGEFNVGGVSVSGCGNLFRFQSSDSLGGSILGDSWKCPTGAICGGGDIAYGAELRTSPVGPKKETAAALAALSANPRRATRKISRVPFKVLDAPALTDDFYLNLVDWSAENVLAVGLGSCVYLWSACTSVVTKLCDLGVNGPVCSVSWSQGGKELAIGTATGLVQLWDTVSCSKIRSLLGHSARVGCLAWNSNVLSSGSRDKSILNRDLRAPVPYIASLSGHSQEVCGLRWSFDDAQLASGGNDNQLLVWSAAKVGGNGVGNRVGNFEASNLVNHASPLLRFTWHEAAVKAIAWSPHTRGLLASGGGTADRTIRFWNTMTNTALAAVDTGSQVCNLAWSKNVNEIVSTHGYSQNQIIVWRYPSLSKVVTLTGHTLRVLYLAVSPSGETIVTGCGDETLRFWNVFPSAASAQFSATSSSLSSDRMHIR